MFSTAFGASRDLVVYKVEDTVSYTGQLHKTRTIIHTYVNTCVCACMHACIHASVHAYVCTYNIHKSFSSVCHLWTAGEDEQLYRANKVWFTKSICLLHKVMKSQVRMVNETYFRHQS